MAHWAKVGVKCQCVEGFPGSVDLGLIVPVEGQIYTIRYIQVWDGRVGLALNEVVNPEHKWKEVVGEALWDSSHFRPLITRTQEQDVELFAPLLDRANHRELERV